MAVPASFLFHDSNLSLFSPQILPYKIICRLLDLNKKIHKFNLFSFFLFLWSSWFLVRFRGICTRYCLTGSVIWIVLIGAGLFTMQKKTTTQHNTQNKKTKQRKREKDQIFILMRSFLSKEAFLFSMNWRQYIEIVLFILKSDQFSISPRNFKTKSSVPGRRI